MKNKSIRSYILIVVFLGVAITFFTNSEINWAEFLIFLFSGILVGINIMKLKNIEK